MQAKTAEPAMPAPDYYKVFEFCLHFAYITRERKRLAKEARRLRSGLEGREEGWAQQLGDFIDGAVGGLEPQPAMKVAQARRARGKLKEAMDTIVLPGGRRLCRWCGGAYEHDHASCPYRYGTCMICKRQIDHAKTDWYTAGAGGQNVGNSEVHRDCAQEQGEG